MEPGPTTKLINFAEPKEVVESTVSVCLTAIPVERTRLSVSEKDLPERFTVSEVKLIVVVVGVGVGVGVGVERMAF